MTPSERRIVEALIAVAWADGEVQAPEAGVIEGLLSGFDATPEEEAEVLEWAKTPRYLRDLALGGLEQDDRETLLSNAALLVAADGVESAAEHALIRRLATMLAIADDDLRMILKAARGSAARAQHE
jgi:uncharacterized tellurite resistance protein B-like protein